MRFPSVPFDERRFRLGKAEIYEAEFEKNLDFFRERCKDEKNKNKIIAQYKKLLTEKVLESAEALDIRKELQLWLNILYQQSMFSKPEAEFLAKKIHEASQGKDNLSTLAVIKTLSESDLYAKEEAINRDLSKAKKEKR